MADIDASQLLRWLYVDMNSFFASVEQQLDPSLRGKPVAVVPLMADTTVCIAVSYEGKACGVKTGTMVRDAKHLCPGILFVEGDHANYIRFHHQIVAAIDSCLPVEAVCSIDEIACRLTGSQQTPEAAQALARKVKATIRERVGEALQCSIGLAPNRYLAKIGADMKKPDGLTMIRPCELPQALFKLAPRDLPGVGAKMEERLRKKGLYTMQQLCEKTPRELTQAWGSIGGEEMWHLLRGEEPPARLSEQKSISHSHVLAPDLRDEPGAHKVLKKLTVKAAARLRRERFFASGFHVFVRYLGQDSWKARCGLMETQDTAVFLNALARLWKEVPDGTFYAVGVAFTGLVPESLHSPSLFEEPRKGELMKALDRLNDKFGKDVVHFGAVHDAGELAPMRIAFTRIPDESEA